MNRPKKSTKSEQARGMRAMAMSLRSQAERFEEEAEKIEKEERYIDQVNRPKKSNNIATHINGLREWEGERFE